MQNVDEITETEKFSSEELQSHTLYFKSMGWKNEKMIPSYKCHEIVLTKGTQSIDKFLVKPKPAESAEDDGSDEDARQSEVGEEDSDDDTMVSAAGDDLRDADRILSEGGEDRSDGDEMESEETDVNQNVLCNKRNIDQVSSSSDSDDVEEPSDNYDGELDVVVTPPASQNSSFQGEPHISSSQHRLDDDENDVNMVTTDNVGKVVKRELLSAFKGDGEYKEIFDEAVE